MITVACVYWKGKFRGRERIYTTEWVERLRSMVARHLPMEHHFVCLSNVEVPCDRIPFVNNWVGWWNKIELFRPGLFEGRTLYLDLDLVILKDLTPIVEFPSKFALMDNSPYRSYTNKEGKLVVDRYNSSVMVFDPDVGDRLYEDFNEACMSYWRGDQDYISTRLPGLDVFPKSWISKVKYLGVAAPPADLKIALCMKGGGAPRKNEDIAKEFKWVEEAWK